MSEIGALLGRVIASKFKIEDHIGSGAMGEVFRARHIILDTVVALKVMRADIAKDAMFKERFYREAKAASRLEHPNSVRVIDFGVEADGLVYLAMEFLHGRDLLSVLRDEWPLPDTQIVDILVQTLGAVAMAHQLGIVHRDLKPENIMVSAGTDEDGAQPYQVKVCDFGIAKLNDPRGFQSEGGKPLTSSGTLIGTPEYMSPEQSRGDPLDSRSDIYSVGVILYQLLVGRVPFTAENALGVVLKQVTDAPVPPTKVRPGVNPALEAICLRALLKAREDRYQTAKEMRRDLRNALANRSVGIDESGPYRPAAREAQSDPDIGAVAATLVIGDVGTAPTAHMPHSEPRARAAQTPAPTPGRSSAPDFAPKQTTGGTELTVATPPRRRLGAYMALAALLVGAGVTSVIVLTQRPWRTAPVKEATASAASAASTASTASTTSAPAPPDLTASEEPSSPVPPRGHASGAPLTATTSIAGRPPPSASGKRLPTAKNTGGAGGAVGSSAPAVAAPAVVTPPSAATATSGPPFNPASAHVSLGGLTCVRVQSDVIARKIAELVPRLSQCYRDELMALGKPLGGSAEIHLSIDDKGNVTPFVNSAQHPGFSRCAGAVFVGQRVPVSALVGDGNQGATVAQWLTLQP